MSTVINRPFVRPAAAACLTAAAGIAAGSDICDVSRYGVPDFDQKRAAASGISGLPNDGKMYCVPTSWVDWLAYMANNGYPGAMGFAPSVQGPRNWSSPTVSEYNGVTNSIATMGTYLGTDPYDGTGGGVGGLQSYLDNRMPDDYFITGAQGATQVGPMWLGPTPKDMAEMMAIGGLVSMGISWYQVEGDHFERHGGHYVAVRSISNACTTTPTIGYRDPWSNDSNTDQDSFLTRYSSCTPTVALFSGADDPSNKQCFYYKLETYTGTTKGFFTSFGVIWPNFGLGIDTVIGKVKLVRTGLWTRELLPAIQQFDFSSHTDGKAIHLALHPYLAQAAVVTEPSAAKPGMLLNINLADGSVRKVHDFTGTPGPIVFGRHGTLFECDGSVLKQINWADGSVRTQRSVAHPMDQIVFDDAIDEVVIIAVKNRRLLQFPEDLSSVLDRPLPDAVQLLDHASMAINPHDGFLNICKGDGSVFKMTRSGAGPLVSISWLLPAVGPDVRSLQFTRKGDALVLDGGECKEFKPDQDGRYQPAARTGFGGQKFGGPLCLPQSRIGIDDRELLAPDTQIPPDDGADEVKDCTADYDGNGWVNGDDFDAFMHDFDAGALKADIDLNTWVNGDDFDTFTASFDQGC